VIKTVIMMKQQNLNAGNCFEPQMKLTFVGNCNRVIMNW